MGYWTHRVVRSRDADGTAWLGIHEVHFDEEGRPYAYTASPVGVAEATVEELLHTLEQMKRSLALPVLDETEFPVASDDIDKLRAVRARRLVVPGRGHD